MNMILTWTDPVVIPFFRLTENPMAGFMIGTAVLCIGCILLGRISLSIVSRINRSYYKTLKGRTVRMHNLSVRAILAKDKFSYQSCNTEANDAFGKYFFSQIALGASCLWPLPFALAWMDTRFHEVGFPLAFPLPGIGDSVRYPAVFILLYILLRILTGAAMRRFVPAPVSAAEDPEEEKMMSWSDIGPPGTSPERP